MVVVLASQLGDLSELGGFGVDSESLSLALLLRRSSKASWLLGSMAIAPWPLRSSSWRYKCPSLVLVGGDVVVI